MPRLHLVSVGGCVRIGPSEAAAESIKLVSPSELCTVSSYMCRTVFGLWPDPNLRIRLARLSYNGFRSLKELKRKMTSVADNEKSMAATITCNKCTLVAGAKSCTQRSRQLTNVHVIERE